MINGRPFGEEVSAKELKVIGIRVLDLYERKLQSGDFRSLMPENITVHNFSKRRPEIITVRGSGGSEEEEQGEENVVWNLAYNLQSLFAGPSTETPIFDELLEFARQVLDSQSLYTSGEALERLRRLLSA